MRGIFGKEENGSSRSSSYNNLRALIERRCLVPQTLNDDDDDNDTIVVRTLLYNKLPQQQLFKLSVLKLDGSLFDVHVTKNATVSELKQAVEEVFTLSPKEGLGKISWSHVWGHFCLCYEGQRLINDKACIRNFGIKDGDQLQFIRHLSINYSPLKRQSKSHSVSCKGLSSGSNVNDEKEQTTHDGKYEIQEDNFKDYCYEDEGEIPMPEFKLVHFLRGWLSYSKLWGVSRRVSEGGSRPSRFALQCLGGGPRMIQL